MSIYEKLTKIRNELLESNDIKKDGKLSVLNQMASIIFRAKERIPKRFVLFFESSVFTTEELQSFLEESLNIKIKIISTDIHFNPIRFFYVVTLI